MNLTDMTIEEMCTTTERQLFDRKSAKIDVAAIAIPMIVFANSDGGRWHSFDMSMSVSLMKALTVCTVRWQRQDCRSRNIRRLLLWCM